MRTILLLICLAGSLSACFKPVVAITRYPHYPVDVFYDNQRPERPYEELQPLESHRTESIASNPQRNIGGKTVGRGNTMQEKELLLAKLTMDAKKMGADALVKVHYQYFTSVDSSGYQMNAMAVRYRTESQ